MDGSSGNNCTQCPTSPDPDSTYCDYGEVCTADGQCLSHELSNSLCQSCNSSNIFANCPSNMICLLDDTQQGAEYCTPFCKTSMDCPNGYNRCNTVTVLANGQCTSDADCDGGRICIGSQEGVVAYCSCLTNADCPQTGASCVAGNCLNLGNPCTSNDDCSVQCTMSDLGDRGEVGTCATKAGVCGKGEGVSCNELKSGEADCSDY